MGEDVTLGSQAGTTRATPAQKRYLAYGLDEPGGKLPLFDKNGQGIPAKTIQACLEKGWVAPWFDNPLKRDWLVCRLTKEGYLQMGVDPPSSAPQAGGVSKRP